jgi:hypothetical protein
MTGPWPMFASGYSVNDVFTKVHSAGWGAKSLAFTGLGELHLFPVSVLCPCRCIFVVMRLMFLLLRWIWYTGNEQNWAWNLDDASRTSWHLWLVSSILLITIFVFIFVLVGSYWSLVGFCRQA